MRIAIRAILPALLITTSCSGSTTASTTTPTTMPPTPGTIVSTPASTAVATIPPPEDPLVVWVPPEMETTLRRLATEFTRETGIEVVLSSVDLDVMLQGVIETEGRGPDVFFGPHTWLLTLAEAGLAEPIPVDPERTGPIVDAVSLRGFPLGVPIAVDAVVQFRNPDLAPAPPASVETMACGAIPTCLYLPADGDGLVHYPFLAALGGYIYQPDPVDGFDTAATGLARNESIAGAEILEGMLAEGAIGQAADHQGLIDAFIAGDAPIIWARASAMPQIVVLDIAVVEPLPDIGGNPSVSAFEVFTAWVSAGSDLKTEAVALAEFLGSPEPSSFLANDVGLAPVWLGEVTPSEEVALFATESGHALPYVTGFEAVWEQLTGAFRRIHEGTSAGEALDDAASALG